MLNWCRGEAPKVRKLPLRLSAGIVCCPPPIFKPSLGRRKKLPQKVGRKDKLAEIVGRREKLAEKVRRREFICKKQLCSLNRRNELYSEFMPPQKQISGDVLQNSRVT